MQNFNDLQAVCVQVFDIISKTTTIFVVPLFLMKIVFSNLLGEGHHVFSTLKSVIVYFCLISAFPIIVDVLFSIPESYLPKMSTLGSFTENSPANLVSTSGIPFVVDRILEVTLSVLYWITYYLHMLFMIVMCSMAPIVFLTSTLLGVGLGVEIFIGLMIVGSSWPIIWYGFDQVHGLLSQNQTDDFAAKCLELLLTLLKGISPLAFAAMIVKSSHGRALTKAAQASVSGGQWLFTKQQTYFKPQQQFQQNHNQNQKFTQGKAPAVHSQSESLSMNESRGAKNQNSFILEPNNQDRLKQAQIKNNNQTVKEVKNENSHP